MESGTSNVNVIPRGNNVLLKIEFEASVLGLTSDTYEKEHPNDVLFSIAGFGKDVHDLTLGDIVHVELGQRWTNVVVKGNNNSPEALKEFYDKLPKADLTAIIRDKDKNKVKVVQYGMFPEFTIKGIIK